ncbi:MAG: SDR family oxidoreductase [Anaerolineae bacterium]|nr:SDR family oxidoreductase [Anaerolineae bacterium]MCB9105799.1 SDR family oxidoreductase [Anaerolineales bacterium]
MTQKVAIITAAGRGMGAAIAKELAANEYAVALMSPSGAAEALAQSLDGLGLTGSVTRAEDLQRLVDQTLERYGRIDAVVNHTGHPPKGPLLAIPDEDWHTGLDLVMLNVVRMARLVTPIMQAQGGGAIVNISTYAVFEPEATFPVSAAMRAALAGFTKLYADTYAADNIRMNNLLPGFIDSLPETAERRARIPMGRYGTVEEIAQTALFLLSPGAGYITGQNIRVDGGITRSV